MVLEAWKLDFLAREQDGAKREYWAEQLTKLYDPSQVAKSLLSGVTTNPPLSMQVIKEQASRYQVALTAIKAQGLGQAEGFYSLYSGIIQEGAAMFRPVYDASAGQRGYLSGQVDNRDYHDLEKMLAMALRLRRLAPNVMVKMPATREGIHGIEILSAMGIPTNATLTFSLSQLLAVAEAVKRGLESARRNGVDLSRFRSVVTFMLGRTEDCQDLKAEAEQRGETLGEEERRWAGLAVFKKAYRLFKERGYESKLLAASMRKGPDQRGKAHVWHIEKLLGADIVLTIFPDILEAFLRAYDGETLLRGIDQEPPALILEKLLRYDFFHKIYDEDGLAPEAWPDFGPVVETTLVFNQAALDMEALVR